MKEVYAGTFFSLNGEYSNLAFSEQGQEFINNMLNSYGLDPEDVEVVVRLKIRNQSKIDDLIAEGRKIEDGKLSRWQHKNVNEASDQINKLVAKIQEDINELEEIKAFYRFSDALNYLRTRYQWEYEDNILQEALERIRYVEYKEPK